MGEESAAPRGADAGAARRTLPVAFLRPNRFQPRKTFAADELEDLANSVREKGVLQPILVRPVEGVPDAFEIVAGERRWRAAQLAKLHDVPVVIRPLSDAESLEFAIIENVQRSDLNAVEEADAYRELMARFAYTQARLAQEVGKSRSHIANTLRLLKLPASVQAMIRDGRLSAGHARTLIGASDPDALAREILAQALNVREAEKRAEPARTGTKQASDSRNADTRALERSLADTLGLKVEIHDRGTKGGELRIVYRSLEQLDDLCQRLSRAS